MSSETDHPRQRTVAELLAEHGGAGTTGATGRRRRRESEEPDDGAPRGQPTAVPVLRGAVPEPPEPPRPVANGSAPDRVGTDRSGPDRSILRDPVPPARSAPDQQRDPWTPNAPNALNLNALNPNALNPNGRTPVQQAPRETPPWTAVPRQAPARPVRERPTDVLPRIREDEPPPDDAPQDLFTRPIPQQQKAPPVGAEDDAAGPSTMIGAAPLGAEAWHRARTDEARRDGAALDDGPPLPAGPVGADEEPAGLGRVRRGAALDLEKRDGDTDDGAGFDGDDDEFAPPRPRERRLGRAAAAAKASATPTWSAVVVQWIAGALGGAVLWVLFRFLWRNLPVVALASAVLVTVGLVVIVRALLHNNDRRTTIFAVLVGLLLTVSPAVLVLLGR